MTDTQAETDKVYRGRFAPSPTGPLHIGSLIAALGSYLEARHQRGEWHVRIDDIDPPREIPGAADHILQTLEDFGFEWDGTVQYQSRHHERYEYALTSLAERGLLYYCSCSRKALSLEPQTQGKPPGYYPGTCRQRGLSQRPGLATRIVVPKAAITFTDQLQGPQSFNLSQLSGDFIVLRNDGLYSYQFATAVDDAVEGYTHILRGSDLLDSTPRQIYLQQCLEQPVAHYGHLPIAINQAGEKLSKQTYAPALRADMAASEIWLALHFLGQEPPLALRNAPLRTIWEWGLIYWQPEKIPHVAQQPITGKDTA